MTAADALEEALRQRDQLLLTVIDERDRLLQLVQDYKRSADLVEAHPPEPESKLGTNFDREDWVEAIVIRLTDLHTSMWGRAWSIDKEREKYALAEYLMKNMIEPVMELVAKKNA